MNSRHSRVPLLALAAALVGSPALAQDKPWIGELVLHVKPSKNIRFVDRQDGKEVVYPFSGTWPFTVREEREGWLRVHDRRREGWVLKTDFVLAREAIPYFSNRIETNPRDHFALRMRGAAWLQKKEPDKAIADFNSCLAVNPNDPAAYNDRALGWNQKKDYEKAITDFTEALRIDPGAPVYHLNRAQTYRFVKEYDKAIADCTDTIHLEPRYAIAFYERGLCHALKKDYDLALKDYDESLRLDPKSATAHRERALILRTKKEYAKAIVDYDEAIKLDPKYSAAMADQAWLLATCAIPKYRDGPKALTLAKKACELTQYKIPSQLAALAAAHAEVGEFKEAAQWMKKALDFPDYAKSVGERGQQRLKLYESGMPYHESARAPRDDRFRLEISRAVALPTFARRAPRRLSPRSDSATHWQKLTCESRVASGDNFRDTPPSARMVDQTVSPS